MGDLDPSNLWSNSDVRGRDLERRPWALGTHCPTGMLEPLAEVLSLRAFEESPCLPGPTAWLVILSAASPGQRIVRYFETPMTVR